MFSRTSAVTVLALTALAVATPAPAEKRWGSPPPTTVTVTAPGPTKTVSAGDCNTGPIQCCQSVEQVSPSLPAIAFSWLFMNACMFQGNSKAATAALGLIDVVLSDVTALVGLTCSPISVIGVGSGDSCSASPVCCENNSFVSTKPYLAI